MALSLDSGPHPSDAMVELWGPRVFPTTTGTCTVGGSIIHSQSARFRIEPTAIGRQAPARPSYLEVDSP